MKDYYNTLNVPKDAAPEVIKKAFRALAKKYHPDAHPDDARAEAMFKDINEAYGVLGDETKKAEYDRRGGFSDDGSAETARGGKTKANGGARSDAAPPPDMSDINKAFENFFGFSPKGAGSAVNNDDTIRPMKTKDAFKAFFGKKF
jgi:molecular chaperone DnaJ